MGSRDILLEFWDPLYIVGMAEARNFKFGLPISHRGVLTKKMQNKVKWGRDGVT